MKKNIFYPSGVTHSLVKGSTHQLFFVFFVSTIWKKENTSAEMWKEHAQALQVFFESFNCV